MTHKMETEFSSVRASALNTLIEVMEKGVFCDKAIHHVLDKCLWEAYDRKLYSRLVKGTVERVIELDLILDQFSRIKVEKMKPVIRNVLRMSLYQIRYMDQIPVSAVCNEAVKLVKKRNFTGLSGFVNGVLRAILRNQSQIKLPGKEHLVRYLSVRYSTPEWLVKRWITSYGVQNTEDLLKEFMKTKEYLTIRLQHSNATSEALEEEFIKEKIHFEKGFLFSDAYHIYDYPRIKQLDSFKRGMFFIQDESSMLVGKLCGAGKGDFVIDLCAAPGGKSLHISDLLAGTGTVVAADRSEEKIKLIRENIKRLKADNISPLINDACLFRKEWEKKADIVIADLPCSGLGVIGRKVDIKYKTKESDIIALSGIQRQILENAVRYLKPGGKLIYSTCTIAKEENEENAFWLEENLPVKRVSIEERLPEIFQGSTGKDGFYQILPTHSGTDGFFVCACQKI